MKFIQSKVFAAILGSVVFMITTAFVTTKSALPLPPPAAAGEEDDPGGHGAHAPPKPDVKGPSWTFYNPEMEQIVAELKTERELMAAKSKELAAAEARLQAERAELDEAVQAVKKIQAEVDREVLRIKDDELPNLKRLAKMYTTMEQTSAAKIFKELDDAVVVKIMAQMKDADSAGVLDTLAKQGPEETRRAAKISEALRVAVTQKIGGRP